MLASLHIAILGATGIIGETLLEVLAERNIAIHQLSLYASPKSKGKLVTAFGQTWTVQSLEDLNLTGVDIVFGALSNELTKQCIARIEKSGALFIDNSSAFRLEEDIPLVIPSINAHQITKHTKLVANPNCSTIIACSSIAMIQKQFGIKAIEATTYQAVSGAGIAGLDTLKCELQGESMRNSIFSAPIAYNVIAKIGDVLADGYTSEEAKMEAEARKIFAVADLKVATTCVRVPVERSHSIALTIHIQHPVSLVELEQTLQETTGVQYWKYQVPTPLQASHQDDVLVGRLRKSRLDEDGTQFQFWCCGDQLRKGAASNAVDILIVYLESSKKDVRS
ncbi:MAG: aspartate-semialdehyde dehydrogenase [Erysipelotrichaceae bacterium]